MLEDKENEKNMLTLKQNVLFARSGSAFVCDCVCVILSLIQTKISIRCAYD